MTKKRTAPSKHVFDESLNMAVDECIERGLPFCQFCGAPTEEIYVDHVIDEEVGAIAGGHSEIRCTKCGKEQGEDDVQPPAPAESAEVEKDKMDAIMMKAVRSLLTQWENVETEKECFAFRDYFRSLQAQRDALQAEKSCCHCGTRDVGFFTCGKCEAKEHDKYVKVYARNKELQEFADDMYTLGDWMPEVRKRDLIELVQKMAHDVLSPSKDSDE